MKGRIFQLFEIPHLFVYQRKEIKTVATFHDTFFGHVKKSCDTSIHPLIIFQSSIPYFYRKFSEYFISQTLPPTDGFPTLKSTGHVYLSFKLGNLFRLCTAF